MNLSVPRVPQRRKSAQRNYNTGDLQKRNLNATPYNDILETRSVRCFFLCVCSSVKYEVHKEMIYGVTYTKPKHQHFWEELNLIYALVCERKQNPCIDEVEIFSQKNILSSFTHFHDVTSLWNTKKIFRRMFLLFLSMGFKLLNSKKDIKISWNWSILYFKSSELAQSLCLTN